MARQFVVQLDNRVGELAHLTRALAARGVDLRSVSCFGHGPLAWACLIPDAEDEMRAVLHGLGYRYIEGEPILVDVEDRPGGLADVAERLAAAGVSVTGTMTLGQRPGILEVAFTVDDERRARLALDHGRDDRGATPTADSEERELALSRS
jgi:hypothetical protein